MEYVCLRIIISNIREYMKNRLYVRKVVVSPMEKREYVVPLRTEGTHRTHMRKRKKNRKKNLTKERMKTIKYGQRYGYGFRFQTGIAIVYYGFSLCFVPFSSRKAS